jgi:NTP pyrophosphatase (non-canonical NTP hydrolase)
MIDEIKKWRDEFNIQTAPDPAKRMFSEEIDELVDAYIAHDKALRDNDEKRITATKVDLAFEAADVLFTLVQLCDAYGIDIEKATADVLRSNYSKRMTAEQYQENKYLIKSDAEAVMRGGYVYLYKDGKLQKPPTFKAKIWTSQ